MTNVVAVDLASTVLGITPHREDAEEKTRTGTKNTARRLRLTLFAGFLSVRT
jgi:hypothetical protein